ncbi:MAG TPA: cytochrome c biogenesis protein CcdA, partial [Rhodothermales bacterium]|nr:cytochrome c biogenesis protein CcdA [Rhodothermales bacterium]
VMLTAVLDVQATPASTGSGDPTPASSSGQASALPAPPPVPADSAEVSAPVVPNAAALQPVNTKAAMPGLGWGFLLLAFGAGLAALLTPCVFPMVPLTVSYFTRHTASRGEALRMAGLYALTIVVTFTGLGLVLALVVGAAGAARVAANPGVNLFIGLVFVAFGLSLLGLYELRLPARFVNRVDAAGRTRGGVTGVVFMGLALTLVSFSCTVPFVGALLAAAAQGAWVRPLVGMLVFSATFALPFFVFALFPRALGRFPKSGAWMDVLRVTLGFVELAAALKFLAQADLVWGLGFITRPVAIALTVVLLGVTGLYLLGLVRLPDTEGQTVGPLRLVAAVAFLGASLYLVPGLWGAPLGLFDAYLPPRSAADFTVAARASGEMEDDGWHVGLSGLDAARIEAAQTGRPVFVDFSGYTCTNCRYMEATVFPKPDVAARLRDLFVLVRVYTDDAAEGEALQRYQLTLTGTVALPTYAILAPDGATLVAVESGMLPAARFAAFLDRAAAGFPVRVATR